MPKNQNKTEKSMTSALKTQKKAIKKKSAAVPVRMNKATLLRAEATRKTLALKEPQGTKQPILSNPVLNEKKGASKRREKVGSLSKKVLQKSSKVTKSGSAATHITSRKIKDISVARVADCKKPVVVTDKPLSKGNSLSTASAKKPSVAKPLALHVAPVVAPVVTSKPIDSPSRVQKSHSLTTSIVLSLFPDFVVPVFEEMPEDFVLTYNSDIERRVKKWVNELPKDFELLEDFEEF